MYTLFGTHYIYPAVKVICLTKLQDSGLYEYSNTPEISWAMVAYLLHSYEQNNEKCKMYIAAEILVPLDKGQCKAMIYNSSIHCKLLHTIQSPMQKQYMYRMLCNTLSKYRLSDLIRKYF